MWSSVVYTRIMQMENRDELLVKLAICSVYDNRSFIKFYRVLQECDECRATAGAMGTVEVGTTCN